MFYIVGLGNPGEQYMDTPHNVGWAIAELLQKKHSIDIGDFSHDGYLQADVARGVLVENEVMLVKPTTFMNESGKSLKDIEKEDHEQIIVIYDDIDLPFGTVKIAKNRGDGGHNGLKSIEQHIKTRNFIRLRVGVCPLDWFGNPRKPKGHIAVQNYLVKRKWSRRYNEKLPEIAEICSLYIQRIIVDGYKQAVSKQK